MPKTPCRSDWQPATQRRQRGTWLRILGGVFALLLGLQLTISQVNAQVSIQATLSTPQTDNFPQVSAYLDVRDEGGKFISGLEPRQMRILENGQPIPLKELRENRVGAQFVVAINPDRPFSIRDGQGITRYEYLAAALETWALAGSGDGQDDLSLLTTTGPGEIHLDSRAAWLAALQEFEPDRAAVPSLEVLGTALDVAADPPARPGMGRAILFITSPPDISSESALQNLAARARQSGTRIYVWMVASGNLFDSPEARILENLAAETGGEFFPYSGVEPLPDLDQYLEPLRSIYWLAYDSQITGSGSHEVVLHLTEANLEIETPAQFITLEIAPPNPIFVSPPSEIVRIANEDSSAERAELLPRTQNLELLIEFPDGHDRQVEQTILYIDGEIAVEKTSPPFDRILWDLSDHTAMGRHLLRVEVVDVLGLRGASIETPIEIVIEQPRQDALAVLSRNGPALAAAAIVMAGAVLFFVLIVGGRLRPRARVPVRPVRRRANSAPTRPISSRVPTQPARGRLSNFSDGKMGTAASARASADPLAYLTRLENIDRRPAKASPIPLTAQEVELGADPDQAMVVLEDKSVDALHACIRRTENGEFQLKDMGTVAGTWINYAPLSRGWSKLQDGDLVHIGRVGFRFSIGQAPRKRKARIVFEDTRNA